MRISLILTALLVGITASAEPSDPRAANSESGDGPATAPPSPNQRADIANADFSRVGPYIGLGIVGAIYTQAEGEAEDLLASIGYFADVDFHPAVGLDLQVGYRLHPRIAAQARFQYLPNTDVLIDGFKIAELDTWTFTGDIKGYLLTNRFQPYALVGLGTMRVRYSDSVGLGVSGTSKDLAVRLAGGFDYHWGRHVIH